MKIKVTLNSGMYLLASADKIGITESGDLFCVAWDMRYMLSRNPRYTRTVSPGEVRNLERVHF